MIPYRPQTKKPVLELEPFQLTFQFGFLKRGSEKKDEKQIEKIKVERLFRQLVKRI
jgi:hypothetical protein